MKSMKFVGIAVIIAVIVFAGATIFYLTSAFAQTPAVQSAPQPMAPIAMIVGFISATVSICVACITAAYAVSNVGTAAMGALSEKPEVAGRALLFVGLAEGIAIYGLIVAIMILGKLT